MAAHSSDRSVKLTECYDSRARAAGVYGKILGLLFVSSFFFSSPDASAQQYASLPESIAGLQDFGSARPVPAWNDFCNRHPAECAVDPRESASIELTPDAWKAIVRINRAVNAEIKPLTDKEQWDVVDSWDFPTTGYGDCEDYQLLKRKRLVEAGFPRRALRMTVVLDELNEGHAVLKVVTDRGDFVLDNKTNAILPWDRTGYVYIKREGHDSTAWISLGGAVASPVAVATAER
ncbi:MAG TPA: transglutaminase-like cysteine peptidase [Saliniramus sp.]|nr:transglutaminase-like cysteine peptidase [Saliniramus sp.]